MHMYERTLPHISTLLSCTFRSQVDHYHHVKHIKTGEVKVGGKYCYVSVHLNFAINCLKLLLVIWILIWYWDGGIDLFSIN